jgi:hypothetical protein
MKLTPEQLQELIDDGGSDSGEVARQLCEIISGLRSELKEAHDKIVEMADRPMPAPVQLPAPPAPPAQVVKVEATAAPGEKPPRVWNLTINRDKEGRMTGVRCEAWLNSK